MKLIRPSLLIVVAGAMVLTVLALGALDGWASRPRLEQMASAALDMDVHIAGATHVQWLPGMGVSADDVHLMRDGAEIGSAQRARITLSLMSLLRGARRIAAVDLSGVTVILRQGPDGGLVFRRSDGPTGPRSEVDLDRLVITDGTLIYATTGGDSAVRLEGCDVRLADVHLAAANDRNVLQRLSAHGRGACKRIQTRDLQVSETKFTANADGGKYVLAPIALMAYGGAGSAQLHADLTGGAPAYELHYELRKFRIEQWLRVFSQKMIATGEMNFTANLAAHGSTLDDLKKSSDGTVSLRGQKLTLEIGDLDGELSRYQLTQQFNVVDLGAILLGGPAAVLLTKGYDFARVLHGPGGTSDVPRLVSDWHLENGIARSDDVAMTTAANRVALKGELDVVNGRFGDLTVAVLDSGGCARVQQKVHGKFGSPEVDKPNVLVALSGPARRLLTEAKKGLLGGHCVPFYSGSVAAPTPAASTPHAEIAAILP